MDPKETKLYIALLTAGLIFCIVVVFFLVTTIRYQKRGVQAYLNRMQADLNLLEKERAQLALDLHDELGSQLAAIQLIVDEIGTNQMNANLLTGKLTLLIQKIRLSIRQLSNSMVSYALQREGLQRGLEELTNNLVRNSSLQIKTEWKLDTGVLNQTTELHLYRIIQELLTNIVKHAQASIVQLSLYQVKNKIILSVADDGIGFNKAQVRKASPGLGLRNVSVRVKILKGHIHLTTSEGRGTAYEIELPIE